MTIVTKPTIIPVTIEANGNPSIVVDGPLPEAVALAELIVVVIVPING
jgi:hypothetical protein